LLIFKINKTMKIYNSEFLAIHSYISLGYLEIVWKIETLLATEKEFKQWNLDLAKTVEQYKPNALLLNAVEHNFEISEELQKWATPCVFKPIENSGVKKMAVVLKNSFLSQLTLELFIEDSVINLTTKYFEKKNEALNWLLT